MNQQPKVGERWWVTIDGIAQEVRIVAATRCNRLIVESACCEMIVIAHGDVIGRAKLKAPHWLRPPRPSLWSRIVAWVRKPSNAGGAE